MKVEIGHLPNCTVHLPRFLIALHKPQLTHALVVGRLYRGYVGIQWNTVLFTFTLWIHNQQKGK